MVSKTEIQEQLRNQSSKVLQDIEDLKRGIAKLKEGGLTEQEEITVKGLQKNISHKMTILSNLERRAGQKLSLMEKHEAGIYGEGPDSEYVNVYGKKLEDLQAIYGDQVKAGQNLADIERQIKSGEIAPYETKTIEVKERSINLPPPVVGGGIPVAEMREIRNQTIRLTPKDSTTINQQQAQKPIMQTVSKIVPYEVEQGQNKQYAKIELREPDRIGEKRLVNEVDIIGYTSVNQKENINPLIYGTTYNIGGQFLKTSYDMQSQFDNYQRFASQQKNQFSRLVALAGSTFVKTSYDLTLGIPVTAVKKGPVEAVAQFNPVRLFKAIKEDKLFISKDPEGRISESLGMIGGVKLGGEVTGRTLEPAIKSFQRYNKNLKMESFTEIMRKDIKKMEYGEFSINKALGEQQKFIKLTESGEAIPQYTDPLAPKRPIEKVTGAKVTIEGTAQRGVFIREIIKENISPKDLLRESLKKEVTKLTEETIKVSDKKPSEQIKLIELEKGEYKSKFTQDFIDTIDFNRRKSLLRKFIEDEGGYIQAGLRSPQIEFLREGIKKPRLEFERGLEIDLTGSKIGLKFLPIVDYNKDIGIDKNKETDRDLFKLNIGDTKQESISELNIEYEIDSINKPTTDIFKELRQPTEEDQDRDRDLFTIPISDTKQNPDLDLESPEKIIDIQEKEKQDTKLFNLPGDNNIMLTSELPLYDVFAKSEGKFIKVNKQPLPENKALNLGADVVDNTASAQFKIKKTAKKGKELDTFSFQKRNKFRKKGNAYIELIRDRIDTVGELQGITVKGWLAKRQGGFNGIL